MSKQKVTNKAEVTDIVRSNTDIRVAIKAAIEKKGYSYDDLIYEAEKKKIVITKAALSRYLNSKIQVKSIPTQEAILFLCEHLKINVELSVEV
jgi:ribosome-binding protein aMBF1 (putative translation factor)